LLIALKPGCYGANIQAELFRDTLPLVGGVLNQVFELFGDVKSFVNHKEEFSSNTRANLAEYFADNQN